MSGGTTPLTDSRPCPGMCSITGEAADTGYRSIIVYEASEEAEPTKLTYEELLELGMKSLKDEAIAEKLATQSFFQSKIALHRKEMYRCTRQDVTALGADCNALY